MLAALVGVVIESADLRAAFPASGERTEDALARVRPIAAVLVDSAAEEATSDVFVARARKRGISVLIFGGPEHVASLSHWARERSITTFALPADVRALHEALSQLPDPPRARSLTERRAYTERSPDGKLILVEASGRRWAIYDRRGADRRDPIHRSFVSDTGETRACDLPLGDERVDSAEVLLAQLAFATPELR